MLYRLVITFLPRNKCLLISWLQSPSAVILEPGKIKSLTVSIVSPSICHEVMGSGGCRDFCFLNVDFFKPASYISSFTFIKRLFCSSLSDITLTKVHLVKAMVFPVVMYGCESSTIKKAEC